MYIFEIVRDQNHRAYYGIVALYIINIVNAIIS